MSSIYFRVYIAVLIISLLLINVPTNAYSQVCLANEEAIDIITLLDASERDMKSLSKCITLVDEVYKTLEARDKKIDNLVKELIKAEQKVIKYQDSVNTWRRATWYTGITAAVLLIIQVGQIL